MTTPGSEPKVHDTSGSSTNRAGSADNQAPPRGQMEAVSPGGLRWWRADPEDWMRGRAYRPRLTMLGVFEDVS
jgi:hypothetical protein